MKVISRFLITTAASCRVKKTPIYITELSKTLNFQFLNYRKGDNILVIFLAFDILTHKL